MTSAAPDVVNPEPSEADELAQVLGFIEAHEARHGTVPAPSFYLSGVEEHDRVEFSPSRFMRSSSRLWLR
jgi:hypothetical protein